MFPDSTIAKSFTLEKTKCGYYITYGIAPYFGELIKTLINNSLCFSLSFDESLNRVLQVEQMDMKVRYCDVGNGLVKLNYVIENIIPGVHFDNKKDKQKLKHGCKELK